jgi:hypothetical protein
MRNSAMTTPTSRPQLALVPATDVLETGRKVKTYMEDRDRPHSLNELATVAGVDATEAIDCYLDLLCSELGMTGRYVRTPEQRAADLATEERLRWEETAEERAWWGLPPLSESNLRAVA